MSSKLLFLSSTNLTTNPRLLKELLFAVEQGYEVDFVGFRLGAWSDEIDTEIIKNLKANFYYIPITRKPFFNWFWSSLIEKIYNKVYLFLPQNLKVNAFALSKRSYLLCKYLKKSKKKYDIIIAHTLPTFFPAHKYATKVNTKFIFDIEDYHPGEASVYTKEKQRKEFLMKKLLPKASYITYASPLIGENSLNLLENYPQNKHCLINNCFSQSEFQYKENNFDKIKFVWFSQNIAAGRGLELVLPALNKFKDKVELHLIGNLYQRFYDEYLFDYIDLIVLHKPLPQKELNLKLSEFDVGLAIELNSVDFNRQICLTNKIWAYLQSGLYILATDTPAQVQFINEHANNGLITKQSTEQFKKNIAFVIENIKSIRLNKLQRFEYAKQFSWEVESKKLKEIWNNILF
ncbi:MAG: hypothetical protein JXR68_08640 [Bacteroidales bacterium]|nr:hypothetical protein [Bacteroidales bacterium]